MPAQEPDPLYVPIRGREVGVRHDDPLLTRYSPVIATLRSAMSITTEVTTVRLVMARARV
jgi:hypothetical protein